MQPSMLLKLLRKLTVDVSTLSEYTTVALRVSHHFHLFLNIFGMCTSQTKNVSCYLNKIYHEQEAHFIVNYTENEQNHWK